MRKTAHIVIKEHLCKQISETRVKNKWTKKKMAEKLAMDDRSYADIEKGLSLCSAVTLIIYIIYVLEDNAQKVDLFDILRKKLDEAWLENDDTT